MQTTTAAPLAPSERIASLDTLRGVAVLGILAMNIQLFAMPGAAYLNPTAYGDLSGINWWIWLAGRLFFDQKFMTIFSLLFGAGILVFTDRAEARGVSPRRLHYRRMAWLLGFGLLHAYGLWIGDILVTYALCGMLVFPLRRMSPKTLILLGLAAISIGSAIWLFFGWSMQFWPAEVIDELRSADWQPGPEALAAEIAAYQGGWWTQMQRRAPDALEFQTFIFIVWGMWRAGGLMLLGMALYRLGVIAGGLSPRFYASVAVIGFAAGVALAAYGVHRDALVNWDVRSSLFTNSQWNYWGSLFGSAGWIALVLLATKSRALSGILSRLGAVGRMAFTHYLMQTVICTTIFYGHGFGAFGRVPRTGQVLVVLGVWALQLTVSPIWLRHFRFGPVEWLWRSLTYGRRQPFRRAIRTDAVVGSGVS